jgi:glycine cleavage system H protein
MQAPVELKYTSSHEWIKIEADGTILVGITQHAQDALGDIIFLELPDINKHVNAGDGCCVIESVKAASDIYSPISGVILEINEAIKNTAEQINQDPYNSWLFKIKPDETTMTHDMEKLLQADDYLALIGE